MKTDNIKLTKESVVLKYRILKQRIERIENLLKTLSVIIDLDSEIKSIGIISCQYEKMYKQVLQTGEYEKYQEIEDTILEKLTKIEFKIDKEIYRSAKDVQSIFNAIFNAIENGKNCRVFRDLDKEIEKIKWIKELAKQYIPFMSIEEKTDINDQINKFKFELLIKRQVEQMVYENGGKRSSLNRFDSEEERTLFESLLEQLILTLEDDDEIKQSYSARQIMEDNLLLTHVVFKVFAQKIEENAEQFIELLNVPIFNPHLCNIANNPYKRKIPYAQQNMDDYRHYANSGLGNSRTKKLERNKINLSLLVAVLRGAINNHNTTIMECENIYSRFGFKCRPITINEGQELIRRIYEKVRPLTPSSKTKNTEKSKGQLCRLRFTPFNYDFNPVDEQFYTNAQIWHCLQNEDAEKAKDFLENFTRINGEQILTRREQREIASRRALELELITKITNDWVREPIENTTFSVLYHTPVPTRYERRVASQRHTFNRGREYTYKNVMISDTEPLWRSYNSDIYGLQIGVKRFLSDICINLDDISDLPIDYGQLDIIKDEQKQFVRRLGESQER